MKQTASQDTPRYDPYWYQHEMDLRFYTKMMLRWAEKRVAGFGAKRPEKEGADEGR